MKGINDAISQEQGYTTSEGDQPSFLVDVKHYDKGGKVIVGQAYFIM